MNKKRLWTRGAAWLLALCLLAGLCVPTVRAEEEKESTEAVSEIENTVEADVIQKDDSVAPLADSKNLDLGLEGLSVTAYTNDNVDDRSTFRAKAASATQSGNSITAKVQSNVLKAFGTHYNRGRVEIKFQNTSENIATLHLELRYENPNYADIDVAGKGQPNTLSVDLKSQQSITLSIQSHSDTDSVKNVSQLIIEKTQFQVKTEDYTATFRPSEHGTLLVDGSEITAETSFKNPSTYKYKLEAKPDKNAGYVFAGWRNCSTGMIISAENPYNGFQIGEDTTIEPVFVPASSPIFQVDNVDYYDLNVANEKAYSGGKLIYLKQGGDLEAGTYTIFESVTLLIPYTESTTAHTTQPVTTKDEDTNRSAFRKLTMKPGATINVYGTINVDSKMYRKQGGKHSGAPTGQYGQIFMYEDTSIVVQSGGNLACWGYITGDGVVRALDGATVRECFEMGDWRGGDATLEIKNNSSKYKIFPLNQYYIQNIETKYELYSGATEIISTAITAASFEADSNNTFIAKNEGMFRLGDGAKMVRKYNPSNDRTTYTIAPIEEGGTGKFYVGQMTITLKIPLISPTLASEDFVLPISSNFTVAFEKGITAEILQAQDIAFLPGARFEVAEGATFIASSNMYVYDRESWVDNRYTRDGDLVPVWYSPTKAYTRTKNDLVDGEIDVNGTMIVQGNGKIYTTGTADSGNDFGANIHSSTGLGKIVYQTAAQATTTTYQYKENGTNTKYQPISCTAARLRNGDGTYTLTAGAKSGWTYFYDRGATEQWYRFKIQFVMKDNPDVIVYQELVASDTASVKLPGLNGTVTTKIAGGEATSEWDAASKTLTLTSISPTIPTDGSAPVLKVKVTAAVNSYKPYFVLNEKQYGNYRSYTGETLTETVKIGGKTYYVVQSSDTLLKFGEKLTGPTDESMGVIDNNHNGITWFLEDTTDGAQVFIGTVPSGETEGGPVYIYGIYSGYEVKVTRNGADEYYTTLKEAVTALPQTGSATVQMLANCGTFEDESKTASYSFIANITFDLNGKEVWGALVNNGTLTLNLNGGSVVYQTGATAPSSTYRASASIVNNGTLTIQDTARGGKITIDAIEDNGSLQNYVSAVRNLGTLTMTGITAETSQTANDYSAVVLNYNGGVIEKITGCHLISTRGYGILNYGATITEISGGNIDGGSSSTVGRYGIRNHNLRTGTQQSKDGYSISKEAKIGTIKDVQIYVYQYGIRNYATIEKITGNTSIQATNGYGISNEAGWYYDTQVTSSKETTSGNVKTTVYTYDTTKYPTIDEISGNTSVTSGGNYALWNAGDIGKISGDLSRTGVQFTRNGNYVLQNSGNIGEITGKVTISGTNGQYVLSQNLWGSTNARCVAQTYIQKDVNENGTYTDVGDVRDYTYEYIAPVIGTIGGGDSEITISGASNVFYNFGTVTNIFDGVTITASGSNALVNGTGGGYATWHTVRTNLGNTNTLNNRYETRVEEEITRYQAEIGSITGKVQIKANGSSAIQNGGKIGTIGNGAILEANASVIANTGVTYTSLQKVYLGYNASSAFSTSAGSDGTKDYGFEARTAEITSIDNATIRARTGNSAIDNGGLIGSISNSTISAAGNFAINNASNVATTRKVYKDNTLTTEYALDKLFDAFFVKDPTAKTYTIVAGSAAPNRIDTYATVPTITEIGAGNTITAAKQAINNMGEITKIAGTEDSKTSVVATATNGQAIYSASALYGTATTKDGAAKAVYSDYKTAAHIGKLENLNVSAAGHGIQNGDGKDYLNVIDKIGTGVVVTSKNNNAVYNAAKNAQIKSISGGVYTAQASGQCAVNNASTTYAIAISDGDFKGGTSNRASAIYDPDNTARQTYPTGYTLSGVTRSATVNGTAADGYYFVTENEFTIVFDGNPATTVSGSVASITVSRTATDVTLPNKGGFTREGFEQVGWALDASTGADSDKLLKLGATVTLAQLGNPAAGAEVRLYAVWKPNKTYNITVTWSGDLSYTYTPAVYRWNGATMKYELQSAAYWTSALGNGKWPSVTVTNAGTDSTKEGTVAVAIAYTRATNYNALNMDFTVGDATTTDSATLSSQLSLRQSASATMKLTGTPPNETANGKVVGSVKLTLTPTDG